MSGSLDPEYIEIKFDEEVIPELEEISKNPADKYGYVVAYFENAYENDLDKLGSRLILLRRGKNSIKQLIHKSKVVNILKNEALAEVPAKFYELLQGFVEDPSVEGKASMVAIIKRYKNFKEENGDDSMFIKILYRLLPDDFIKFRELEGMRGDGIRLVGPGHGAPLMESPSYKTPRRRRTGRDPANRVLLVHLRGSPG